MGCVCAHACLEFFETAERWFRRFSWAGKQAWWLYLCCLTMPPYPGSIYFNYFIWSIFPRGNHNCKQCICRPVVPIKVFGKLYTRHVIHFIDGIWEHFNFQRRHWWSMSPLLLMLLSLPPIDRWLAIGLPSVTLHSPYWTHCLRAFYCLGEREREREREQTIKFCFHQSGSGNFGLLSNTGKVNLQFL